LHVDAQSSTDKGLADGSENHGTESAVLLACAELQRTAATEAEQCSLLTAPNAFLHFKFPCTTNAVLGYLAV
jgi:hypothetical protein